MVAMLRKAAAEIASEGHAGWGNLMNDAADFIAAAPSPPPAGPDPKQDEVPLPHHPEPHSMTWTKLEIEAIRKYGQACARAASMRAAQVCREQANRFTKGGGQQKPYAAVECALAIEADAGIKDGTHAR
jgi:hypothetical protein